MTEDNKRFIVPPPSLIETIHKTAQRVAQKGTSFENGLKANPTILSNVTFNFLKSENPYHLYYTKKIEEYRQNLSIEYRYAEENSTGQETFMSEGVTAAEKRSDLFPRQPQEATPVPSCSLFPNDFTLKAEEMEQRKLVSKFEYKIVALTARYLAVYGDEFAQLLVSLEKNNHYFQFLEPSSPWNSVFRKLYDAYTKILNGSADLSERIWSQYCVPMGDFICQFRREVSLQVESEKKNTERKESERKEDQQVVREIDWDNFHVVETLDLC